MKQLQLVVLSLVVATGTTASAQESPSPQPPPSPSVGAVRINFLPPPLEGTISLGIYNPSGKLVRILHREADLDEFTINADALATTWDGKDDSGATLPPGKYRARGFMVGDLEIEGVGFFFNDWVTNEHSPRIRKISGATYHERRFLLNAEAAGIENLDVICHDDGNISPLSTGSSPVNKCVPPSALKVVAALSCDSGRDNTLWVIDRLDAGAPQVDVKQFSAGHELLRRLSISPGDPQPVQIAASKDQDEIMLLEESDSIQRIRKLKLLATTNEQDRPVSDWKIEFEKKIVRHKDFALANGKPVISSGNVPPEKIAVLLAENPLQNDKKETVELAVGHDVAGSFLKTADGLPLQTISETRNLTRVVLSPQSKTAIDVFQDDEAVVEQFSVRGLDQMMAFDCGEIELK